MLNLSEVLIQNPELESFEELVDRVRAGARTEFFFRMDIRPPYPDTPANWETILESVFSSASDTSSQPPS